MSELPKGEEERCATCSYSLGAHRKQPPERSQFVCDLYLDGNPGAVPKSSHVRPKRPPNFFQFFALNEVAEK